MTMMPQNCVNDEDGRRAPCCDICKVNSQVNGQVPGTNLVNGAAVHHGHPAAAAKTRGSGPPGMPNGAKPQCTINGYINDGYKGKKDAPPKTLRNQGTISAITDASAVGGVRDGQTPGGVSVNGATRMDAVALPFNSDETAPQSSPSAAAKEQTMENIFRHDESPPQMPPREEEDWENEILIDGEKSSFGVQPYGPEDVLHFALRDLTLQERDTADLPVTANYQPVVHHQHPIQWFCCNIPTEPGQFADADE